MLLFSALFSGSEVAFFSLDKNSISELKTKSSLINNRILYLLNAPRRLLITILIGNTLFNVGASIVAVTIAIEFAIENSFSVDLILLIQIVLLTVFVLIFGEVLPKVYASKNPLFFAKIIALPISIIHDLLYPVSKPISDLLKAVAKKFHNSKSNTAITASEISDLVDFSVESGTIDQDEHELISGLVSFKTIMAREVMTPRVDVTAIPIDSTIPQIMALITESGHSRIPLYRESIDDIIGIIYAKDLLPFIGNDGSEKISLKKLCRTASFIPETKLINQLLGEFQENKTHIGIVVDEYGGTSGVITLEDILEEIVGEIRDEYDKEEQEITMVNENEFIVLGKSPVDEVNEKLEIDIRADSDDFDTIGGFIFNHAGTIPEVGFKFEYQKYLFTVLEVENKRINKIRIKKQVKD